MLFPALFALGGAFFFFVLRVQGADGSFPKPLTPDEEAVLLRRMQQDGDAEAREKLIEHNLRLVAHIVKKYYAVSTEQDDLLSIGTIGLIKAVNTFKADKNLRLASHTPPNASRTSADVFSAEAQECRRAFALGHTRVGR